MEVDTNKHSSGNLYKYFDIEGNFKSHNAISDVLFCIFKFKTYVIKCI